MKLGPNPRKLETVDTGGRTLVHGMEFTVKGEGRFAFRYGWQTGRAIEVTCYGPVTNPQAASWRTFPLHRITTIHNGPPKWHGTK